MIIITIICEHCKRCCTYIRKIAAADDPMANTRNPPPVIAYRNAALQLVHAVQILLFFSTILLYIEGGMTTMIMTIIITVNTIICARMSLPLYCPITRIVIVYICIGQYYCIAHRRHCMVSRSIVNHSHLSCVHFARVRSLCRSGDGRKTKTTTSRGKKTHVNNSLLPTVAITSNDSILYIFALKQIFAYCGRRRRPWITRIFFFPFRSNGIAKCFIFYTKKGYIMYISTVFYLFYKALNDNEKKKSLPTAN